MKRVEWWIARVYNVKGHNTTRCHQVIDLDEQCKSKSAAFKTLRGEEDTGCKVVKVTMETVEE